jgi:hypothetical protein
MPKNIAAIAAPHGASGRKPCPACALISSLSACGSAGVKAVLDKLQARKRAAENRIELKRRLLAHTLQQIGLKTLRTLTGTLTLAEASVKATPATSGFAIRCAARRAPCLGRQRPPREEGERYLPRGRIIRFGDVSEDAASRCAWTGKALVSKRAVGRYGDAMSFAPRNYRMFDSALL